VGPLGVWSIDLRFGDRAAATDAAAELEALGYSALWLPGGTGGVFEVAAGLLDATNELVVASAILSIWECGPADAAGAHADLTAKHPGRFLLGLGVSHAPIVDRHQPGRYRHPTATMSAYLDDLDSTSPPVPREERLLAALGPRMLGLARDRSAGTHPYLVTPEHTYQQRALLGPTPLIATEQAVVLETDAARARDVAREHLQIYLGLPNYVNNWRRAGFGEDDISSGGSDRLVDALVAWGEIETVVRRLRDHRDAGADHVCVQVLGAPDPTTRLEAWRALAEAWPLGGSDSTPRSTRGVLG